MLSSVVTPFLKTLQTQNLVSLAWSGYSVTLDALYPLPLVESVSGVWMVPTVAPSATNTYSVAWVGVGGQSDSSLIQTGSEHSFINGEASYSLWYELLPDNAITIQNVSIAPGHQIAASITLTDANTDRWLIQITDATTGEGFTHTVNYDSSRLTAEWIVERPNVNSQVATLADFGTLTFTQANARIDSVNGTISSFPNYKIHMQTHQYIAMVSVSPLDITGSVFTIEYI